MRADLPSGTVTSLFTDVEGSTKLLDELGSEVYAHALSLHRQIVRRLRRAGRRGGRHPGRRVLLRFLHGARRARGVARDRRGTELRSGRVRIGLHTGTPLLTDEGYVGADVHRAARIAASGHGGQVLVSAATAALGVEHDGLSLHDLGEHRFKDLAASERVFQLGDRRSRAST